MNPICVIHRNPLRRRLGSRLRGWWHRLTTSGLTLDASVTVGKNVVLETWRAIPGKSSIRVEGTTTLEDGVRLEAWQGHIEIEKNVYLGPDTKVYGHGGVSIGENTLIAMNCCILSSEHSIPSLGVPIRSQEDVCKETRIGSDVWLGAGVIVLAGVTIGDGAVIGAGSVVTSDIEPGSICVGVPARKKRSRASEA